MPNYVAFEFQTPVHHTVFGIFLLGQAERDPSLRDETNNVAETIFEGGRFVMTKETVSVLKSRLTRIILAFQDKESEENMQSLYAVNEILSTALFQ